MSLRIVAAFAAVALSVVGLLGWLARTPTAAVDIALARERPLTVRVTTNGLVEPIDKAEVRARLDGRVVEIPEAGASVRQGELLLKIAEGPTAAELARTESERLAALESLREAQDKMRRTQRRAEHDERLFREAALTQERLDETRADLRETEARVRFLQVEVPLRVSSLDHRIALLSEERAGAEVRAAFDGVVYKAAAKPGQRVSAGEVVVWFADLARLRVRANIDQVDLGRVRVGQEVEITSNAYPGRAWSARIGELIPNVVKKQSRFVSEALATIEAPAGGLVPGMGVDVEIAIEAVSHALQIPADALFSDELGSFVYRLEGERARLTRVEVGRSTLDTIEITHGLSDRDRVVVGRVAELRDGERIESQAKPAVGAAVER